MAAVVRGQKADFQTLALSIGDTLDQIGISTFLNLDNQFKRASEGLANFKEVAKKARLDLEQTEVGPHLKKAADIEKAANEQFAGISRAAADAVSKASKDLDAAILADDKKLARDLAVKLEEAKSSQKTGAKFAAQQRAAILEDATLERQIAALNASRLIAQEQGQVEAETRRILEAKLKIYQQMNIEAGKALTNTLKLRDSLVTAQIEAESGLPRTDLQAGHAEINQLSIRVTADVEKVKSSLRVLTAQLDELGKRAVVLNNQQLFQGFSIERENEIRKIAQTTEGIEQLKFVTEQMLGPLEEMAAKLKATKETVLAFATSLTAIENATRATLNGITDALLNSFEGKKTDFARLFKGITDNLFKDSLKDVFKSLETDVKKGFIGAFKGLGISDAMAETLGPAFLAGFALIASFVLGQLLGGNKATATPGNPTVGITSSEQVRGLIGGETQIPIGLVGESLQNALVPTNLLLQRIAFGVERMTFGGISSQAIENVISQSISESLQIQLTSH
jgi:hypothetical protein